MLWGILIMTRTVRVLIAELNPNYAPLLSYYLAQTPFITIVGEAYDGEEALRLAIETKPDFFILSASMMKLMGWEVLERIPPAAMPPWIIVTGTYGEKSHNVQMALARGAHRYAIAGNPRWVLQTMIDLLREYAADLKSKKKRFGWLSNIVAKCSRMMHLPAQTYP